MQSKPYIQHITLNTELIPSYEEYPFNIPFVKNFPAIKFHPDVTFFVGENGSGKSTLMEAIALKIGFSIEGGSKNIYFKTHNNSSVLCDYIKVGRGYKRPADYYFLRAESFYNIATHMEELYENDPGFAQYYGVESLHQCSHGEAFIALLSNRLHGKGLYLFDEPEAALSPIRQLTALSLIHKLVCEGSQFIIATHSPILLAYPNAMIYQFDGSGIKRIHYEETEHFMVTKYFLNNYENMMNRILGE